MWRRHGTVPAYAIVPTALLLASPSVHSCSNILVSRGASSDNSTMIAYNSDGESFYGYMTSLPRGDHAAGAQREVYEFGTGIYKGSIPEAPHTYNVIGNMNEHGVAIGETTFDGLGSLAEQDGAIIDYYSLMWLALQRSATAREAILTMDSLTKLYGYASTGESFSVSDPTEAWHVDWIGKGQGEKGAVWVAMKVPEGHIGGHANQARITTWPRDTAVAMWAPDVVDFAVAKGLYPKTADPLAFSFADVYDPLTPLSARLCEARVWDLFQFAAGPEFGVQYLDYAQGKNLSNRMPLFIKPNRPFQLNDTMWAMRQHYEGTWFDSRNLLGAGPYHSPYRARPVVFEVDGATYAFNRNLGYVGTFFHFVAHCRPVTNIAGSVIWFGVDDSSLSVRVPMYSTTSSAPSTWAYGVGDTAHWANSAYWRMNAVANFAYSRHALVGTDVQTHVVATERHLMDVVATADAKYSSILASEGRAAAEAYLTNVSVSSADQVTNDWANLWTQLFVKYRDGLIVDSPPKPAHPKDLPPPPGCSAPGYDSAWLSRILKDTGDHYLLPKGGNLAHQERKLALLSRR